MTPEEIDKLTASPELDALVLVTVCGWKWRKMRRDDLCQLIPPPNEPNGWEPSPKFADEVIESTRAQIVDYWPKESERYDDWDQGCVKHHANGVNWERQMPSPSSSWSDMRLVVDEMHKRGAWFSLVYLDNFPDSVKHGFAATFCGETQGDAEGDDAPLATCRAALRACMKLEEKR